MDWYIHIIISPNEYDYGVIIRRILKKITPLINELREIKINHMVKHKLRFR